MSVSFFAPVPLSYLTFSTLCMYYYVVHCNCLPVFRNVLGYTKVVMDDISIELSVCHVMEVADVVADHYQVIEDHPNEDILTAVSFLTEEICATHPHLLCTRLTPALVRDLGMPHYPINDQNVIMRQGYSALDLADCLASVGQYPFSTFTMLAKSFTYLLNTQDKYLTNMQRCGFQPSVVLDCGAHVGSWSNQVKQHRFPEATVFMVRNEEKREERREEEVMNSNGNSGIRI